MRILALMAALALVGCSRNDKTATEEPVGTTTITLAPVTVVGGSEDELELGANAATVAQPTFADGFEGMTPATAVARVTGMMETLHGVAVYPFSIAERDDRTQFHIMMALLRDADFVDHASDIDVKVDHGAVTIEGITSTPSARTSAERIASQEPGVVSVDNRLRIGPLRAPNGHR